MRKKLPDEKRRKSFIGIKVKDKTKNQLEYIAKRDAKPLSTLINEILLSYIDQYFKISKINWDDIPDNEK